MATLQWRCLGYHSRAGLEPGTSGFPVDPKPKAMLFPMLKQMALDECRVVCTDSTDPILQTVLICCVDLRRFCAGLFALSRLDETLASIDTVSQILRLAEALAWIDTGSQILRLAEALAWIDTGSQILRLAEALAWIDTVSQILRLAEALAWTP
jgi:hypothetical protein